MLILRKMLGHGLHQGEISYTAQEEAELILSFAELPVLALSAVHIASKENCRADFLSH